MSRTARDGTPAIVPLRPKSGMLKKHYRRMALVNDARHLEQLPVHDPEITCCVL